MFSYRLFFWSGLRREMWLYAGGFLLQGAIALLVVIAAFGGSQVGVSLGEHDFRSERLSWFIKPYATIRTQLIKQFAFFASYRHRSLNNTCLDLMSSNWIWKEGTRHTCSALGIPTAHGVDFSHITD